MAMGSAAVAVQATSPGAWQTVTQWGSNVVTWLDKNVVHAVAPFFQACLNHINDNKEAYTWGAIGIAVGTILTALFSLMIQGKGSTTPTGTSEGGTSPDGTTDGTTTAAPEGTTTGEPATT